MGVYGNIHGAFNGLGKPSIKLEFENNDDLLDFQRRMQEGGDNPDGDTPDGGGNFTQGEQVLDRLSRLATGRPYLKATPGGEMTSNEEPVVWNEEKGEFEPLDGYGDKYVVTDLRKRAKKEPGDVAANKNLKFEKQKDFFIAQVEELIANYDYERKNNNIPTAPGVENLKTHLNNYYLFANKTPQYLFMSVDEYNNNLDKWKKVLVNDVSNIARYVSYYDKIKPKGLNTGLGAPGDTYIITDTRTRARKDLDDTAALKKYDIRKFSGEELQKMQTEDPLLYEQIKSDLQQQTTPVKQKVKTKEDWMREADKMLEIWKDEAFHKTTPQKLDEPGSRVKARYISNLRAIIIKYFIEEIEKGNYERVSNIANILGYKHADNERISQTNGLISQFVGIVPTLPEGWRISKNIPKWLPKLPKGFIYIDNNKEMFDYRHKIMPAPKGLGKTANNSLYNNLEILDFRGMQPTYRQLSNYDAFFNPAVNKNSLKGWGLNDTKKLIADICRNHYKECAAIAKYLKAETKLQSAFNLWHWLHHNIRYEYDREGREEVRTPSRTWADRHRGVDCDCLSVFAWCVLKCMGYNPAFELAAFRNKPAYSHIYINLDGIVVDRVWYVFNSRPPFITKTEQFKVGMLDNLGQLF